MKKTVRYISLPEQYSQIREEIIEEINSVLDSGMFILGSRVELFEREFADYLGAEYCVGVGSGTAAIRLALSALGIGENDEVIIPANSFLATAGAVAEVGAVPVFADVSEDMNIEPSEIIRLTGPKTKAVIPVHLTGRPARMKEITEIAKEKGLFIVEDCAQAVGAKIGGQCVGTFGEIGCFSFHPLKTLNCAGDGGAVVTDSPEIADRIKILRNHGLVDRDHCEMWGTNSRLDAIQAAVLSVNLRHLDKWTEKRIENARRYSEGLNSVVRIPGEEPGIRSVYHTYVIQADHRDELKEYLGKHGIENKIHYPVPIHRQTAAGKQDTLPMCERQAKRILSLPVHQYLTEDKAAYVISKTRKFYDLREK